MRILTLTHEYPPLGGGGGRVAQQLAERLVIAGHSVDVVTMAFEDLPRHEAIEGVDVFRVPSRRRKRELSHTDEKLLWVLASLGRVRSLLRERHHDLIHCHFIVPAMLIPWLLRVTGRVPCVVTCHGSDVPGYNPDYFSREHALMAPLWRRLTQCSALLIPPSVGLQTLICQADPELASKVTVIPNGYPADRYRCSSREPKVLLASRMLPRKGFQYFLHAIEGIDIGYEVNIVGDGPYRSEIEALVAKTPSRVTMWGWLDNDSPELRELYETSAIFVFASEAENFPIALLEAMTAGLAIITTTGRGCPEVVGDTAMLVPPRDPEAILRCLRELIADPARAAALGDAARRRVVEELDWPIVLRQYEEAFQRATG
jgi:glycosyltransferase involved in cell wall biosynthesis